MPRRSLAITIVALLLASAAGIFLLTRPKPPAVPPGPVPTAPSVPAAIPPQDQWHAVLNLYAVAPPGLPQGYSRVEMTLIKAELMTEDGRAAAIFEGGRRIMLQPGVVQKLVSDAAPQGRWAALKLTFSPAAELVAADGSSEAALVEGREATIVLEADLPISRTLAVFAHMPLLRTLEPKGGVTTIDLDAEPRLGETYVLGGIFRDPRGIGQILMPAELTLAAAVKEDLNLDIRPESKLQGSQGFEPSGDEPPRQ